MRATSSGIIAYSRVRCMFRHLLAFGSAVPAFSGLSIAPQAGISHPQNKTPLGPGRSSGVFCARRLRVPSCLETRNPPDRSEISHVHYVWTIFAFGVSSISRSDKLLSAKVPSTPSWPRPYARSVSRVPTRTTRIYTGGMINASNKCAILPRVPSPTAGSLVSVHSLRLGGTRMSIPGPQLLEGIGKQGRREGLSHRKGEFVETPLSKTIAKSLIEQRLFLICMSANVRCSVTLTCTARALCEPDRPCMGLR